jgi:hypothetical protein
MGQFAGIDAHVAYEDERQCIVHIVYCGNVVEGIASCHHSDDFDRSVGRQVALSNALSNLSTYIKSSVLDDWPNNSVLGFLNPVSVSYCPVCQEGIPHAQRQDEAAN